MGSKDFPDQFKKLGPEQVRTLMATGGIAQTFHRDASDWLAEQDQESSRRKEASQAEQIEIARSAKDAAWEAANAANNANTLAKIAIAIAVISTIVAMLGVWIATAKPFG